ncbi:1,2-phenylacetyl-CoA epoxidase subunit PaaE [Nocardioides sp. DS6]|uniref:1,2-phenylacetyl-CoA epoxidase subunit PaaE n=1 Tax=Nocardioides eburneus TaxID=3231482 RepID=A0ABV3T0P8_9ACTN
MPPAATAAAAPARAGTAFHPLTVAAVEPLTDDAVAVTFDVPEELRATFAFDAGQSLTLRRMVDGVEQRRTYSICAAVGSRPRIGVREVPDGLFSRWLVHEMRPGDVVEVQPPSGSFRADATLLHARARHLCIAAGSGITPMLSIAASALAAGGEVTLLYGNRTTASVMFAEELADLKNAHPARFDLVHVLSREPRDVELFSGRLDPEQLRLLLGLLVPLEDVDQVWLCGPFAMTTAARDLLLELGVPAPRIHRELFFVDEPPPELHHRAAAITGVRSEVEVVLDGRRTTHVIPRDRPLLDAVQEHRGDLPFACKGGVCGTCRARLVRGEVDLVRNYALEPAEVEAGFVLTCQSYPRSEALTVDFDA